MYERKLGSNLTDDIVKMTQDLQDVINKITLCSQPFLENEDTSLKYTNLIKYDLAS